MMPIEYLFEKEEQNSIYDIAYVNEKLILLAFSG